MNAAFSGNKEHVKDLEKKFQKIFGNKILGNALENVKPDSDWKSRLSRFKR